MNTDNWKLELDRLLEIFERESTASLRTINRCFVASGCPFDEEFRKYFVDSSNRRLNTSFDTVLLERRFNDRMKMSLAVGASANDDEIGNTSSELSSANDRIQTANVLENQSLCRLEVKVDAADALIEIVDSDDGSVVEVQQMQAANDSEEDQTDSNVLLAFNDGDANHRQNGAGINDASNGAEIHMKREAKVEIEIEMEDLPFVAFDPNENSDNFRAENGVVAAEFSNVQIQSNPLANAQKQPKQKHISGQVFKCTDCKYSTLHKFHFTRHQQIHDTSAIKPFKCEHCNYDFRQKSNLKRHQRMHERQQLTGIVQDPNDGLFKCTHCDRQFTKGTNLRKHLKVSHKNNQRLFNCAKCLRRFALKAEKETHEVRCQNRSYECYLCKTYVTRNIFDMRRHMPTHSGAKPFECTICNKRFRYKLSLIRHLSCVHGQISGYRA